MITITPHILSGHINVPTSKSLAHRAIICASLAKGKSVIKDISMSLDIKATINAMKALGTSITIKDKDLIIDGTTTFTKKDISIDCIESGSTLRFMVPITLIQNNKVHFTGQGKLGERPLSLYYDIFDKQNINYTYNQNKLDLHIEGQLLPDYYLIPGNISSQFITGLLFALPLLDKNSLIELSTPLESKGYIDLTLSVLQQFGIQIKNDHYQKFVIKGNQKYKPTDYTVEADYSQAANFLVANYIGNDITIDNLNKESLQGDKVIIEYLNSITDKTVLDAKNCPDIIPILSVALALSEGTHTITNVERLRIKECDRLEATYSILKNNGVPVDIKGNNLIITGINEFTGGNFSSYNDHRIAMMLSIMSTRSKNNITIDNKECVQKSYPHFFKDFKTLGGDYHEC